MTDRLNNSVGQPKKKFPGIIPVIVLVLVALSLLFIDVSAPRPLSDLAGTVCTRAGHLVVISKFYRTVQVYDSDNQLIRSHGIPGAKGGHAVSIDARDNLWIRYGRSMQKLDSDGRMVKTFTQKELPSIQRTYGINGLRLGLDGYPFEFPSFLEPRTKEFDVLSPGDVIFPYFSGALMETMPPFRSRDGHLVEIISRFWLPMIRITSNSDQIRYFIGRWWTVPLTFPSPLIPICVVLFILLNRVVLGRRLKGVMLVLVILFTVFHFVIPSHTGSRRSLSAVRLINAAATGKAERIAELIQDGGDVDEQDKHCRTPVLSAIDAGNLPGLVLLLSEGADPNAVNRKGFTPMILAARQNSPEILTALIDAGGRVDQPGPAGWSPLVFATVYSQSENVRTLINAGADVNFRTEKGETALMWALGRENHEISQLLRTAGASEEILTQYGWTASDVTNFWTKNAE